MATDRPTVRVLTSPVAFRKFSVRGPKRDRRQLLDMQQALYEMALSHDPEPHVRAACARAWSDLQERKRVLDGKPLPGQLRPDLEQRRKRKTSPSPLLAIPLEEESPHDGAVSGASASKESLTPQGGGGGVGGQGPVS